MAAKESLNQTFETALEQLEQIVERLESGELSLEDSLAAFEAGVGLVKHCNQKLNEVEKNKFNATICNKSLQEKKLLVIQIFLIFPFLEKRK